MKLKPGKYVQRDGGIATVAAVDETRSPINQAIGWSADGEAECWNIDGSWGKACGSPHDLVREYREPKEGWAIIFPTEETAKVWGEHWHGSPVRVREVIE